MGVYFARGQAASSLKSDCPICDKSSRISQLSAGTWRRGQPRRISTDSTCGKDRKGSSSHCTTKGLDAILRVYQAFKSQNLIGVTALLTSQRQRDRASGRPYVCCLSLACRSSSFLPL